MYKHMMDYLSKDIYPFHMPGHKRNRMFFPDALAGLDLTEIPGMDNLRAPGGIIDELQRKIAEFCGADESYILVNGATAGVVAAICAACEDGGKLYAARNGHVSMYSGMALAGAVPVYVAPEIAGSMASVTGWASVTGPAGHTGLAGGISPQTLDNMEEGAAAIIVSPTYEGFVSDIKTIAGKVHSRGGILIVDEAHGAHFPFHDAFPDSALALGADIVVQSFHKTLPVLGQLAVLHVKGPRVDRARLRFYIQAMQTTSPSYMLMAQLDYALGMLWARPELFEMYIRRLDALRKALAADGTPPIELVGEEVIGRYGIHDIDRGKLLFCINIEESAEDVAAVLAEYRLQLEMAAGRYMLAMTSVADTDDGIQRLWAAVGAVNIRLGEQSSTSYGPAKSLGCSASLATAFVIPDMVIPPRQAARKPTEAVPWQAAVGRISGEVIAAYPPGIALVAPGERIPSGLPQLATHVRVIK